jgi:hypothetical protein
MTPTEPSPQELRWLDALTGPGTSAPVDVEEDPAVRQALQLRDYFARTDQALQECPPDAHSEERMVRRLRDRGALPMAPTRLTLGQRLTAALDWLMPAGAAMGPRYALVAGLALAVTLLPLVLHAPAPEDDLSTPKGLQPGTCPGTRLMIVPDPGAQAAAITKVLAETGIQSTLKPMPGGDIELVAHIEPGQRRAAQARLMPWGLVITPNVRLLVASPRNCGQPTKERHP